MLSRSPVASATAERRHRAGVHQPAPGPLGLDGGHGGGGGRSGGRSCIFLVGFLPFVLAAYFLSPRRFRNVCLILASLFFYAWGEREFAWVVRLSIVGNYVAGVWIARSRVPMRVLAVAVMLNLPFSPHS